MKYRLYGLVPYNLSDIQKSIQFGHALQEYNNKMFDEKNLTEEGDKEFDAFHKWRLYDKTFIILNGGTTNDNRAALGTLNQHMKTIHEMNIEYATFNEPDLGDQLTAVVFLLDERVWDTEKYPSPKFELDIHELVDNMGGNGIWNLRQFIKQFRLA